MSQHPGIAKRTFGNLNSMDLYAVRESRMKRAENSLEAMRAGYVTSNAIAQLTYLLESVQEIDEELKLRASEEG